MRSNPAWEWTLNSGYDAPYRYIHFNCAYCISYTWFLHSQSKHIDLYISILPNWCAPNETKKNVIVHNVKWMNVMHRCWIHIVSILSDYKVLRRCSISNCHSCLWLHYSCVEFLSFIVFHTLMSYVVHGVPFFRFSRCTLSIRLSSLFPSNLCRNRFIVRPLYVNYYRTVTDLLSSICWVLRVFRLSHSLFLKYTLLVA